MKSLSNTIYLHIFELISEKEEEEICISNEKFGKHTFRTHFNLWSIKSTMMSKRKSPSIFKGKSFVIHMFKYLAILFNAELSFKIEFKWSEFAVC